MKFAAILALASVASGIKLSFDYDTTGTYSPKPNMYTGFEGSGNGRVLTYTN